MSESTWKPVEDGRPCRGTYLYMTQQMETWNDWERRALDDLQPLLRTPGFRVLLTVLERRIWKLQRAQLNLQDSDEVISTWLVARAFKAVLERLEQLADLERDEDRQKRVDELDTVESRRLQAAKLGGLTEEEMAHMEQAYDFLG